MSCFQDAGYTEAAVCILKELVLSYTDKQKKVPSKMLGAAYRSKGIRDPPVYFETRYVQDAKRKRKSASP